MARWDDLRRAFSAKADDEAKSLWTEMMDSVPSVASLVGMARQLGQMQGGKRMASELLEMLAQQLKDKGQGKDLVSVLGAQATMTPDNGPLRAALVEAVRSAYAGRADLEALLEKSGVVGGTTNDLAAQAQKLERYLRLEPEAWVLHATGWGVGQLRAYHAERGRCVIDFLAKAGHEMDIDAAATALERLSPDDLRVLAVRDPAGLRTLAEDKPDEVVRLVLVRMQGEAVLRQVRSALVPDAVSDKGWTAWWKKAKKLLLIDPRFAVGTGADPRITFQEGASVDFQAQVNKTLRATATTAGRQKAVRDLMSTVGADAAAKDVLAKAVEVELSRGSLAEGERVGWDLLLADLRGRDRHEAASMRLADGRAEAAAQLAGIAADDTRASVARAVLARRADGVDVVFDAALRDDPVVAEVAVEGFEAARRKDLLEALLDRIERAPLEMPNLYVWMLRHTARKRWATRPYDPKQVLTRALRALDQVEYRAKREGQPRDRKASQALQDFLGEKECRVAKDVAAVIDGAEAAWLMGLLDKNRGLKVRLQQKLQEVLMRVHPTAGRTRTGGGAEAEEPARASEAVFMTRAGLERWRVELERLLNVEIPANAAEIARAREFGDLRENAEYHAAREKQSLLQAKAETLRNELSRAVPITPEIVRRDSVSVGVCVRVREDDGREQAYTLWGPPDVDVERGIINYLTPLGRALMGSSVGQQVRLEVDGSVRGLTIVAIEVPELP
ncbi:MAG: GreA/GreB family elongation factor [Planctomycetia bacterium]